MRFLRKSILETKGITLIELIVVLAIIGIILSVSIPKNPIRDYKLKFHAKELTSDIRKTRYLKLTKGTTNHILLKPDSYLVFSDNKLERKVVLKDITLMYELSEIISFNHNGSPKVGATIILNDNITNKKYKVTIVPFTGRVLVQKVK